MNPQGTTVGTSTVTGGFVRVCSVNDLPKVGAVQVEIDGSRLAIVRDSTGDIHAIDDTGSHATVSLAEGEAEHGGIARSLCGSRSALRP